MKKILVLALAALLLLPVLPAYAADKTTVIVAGYNDYTKGLQVGLRTSAGFAGATIYVGDSITHTLSGTGSGYFSAVVPLGNVEKPGEVALKVVSDYGSAGEETYETTVNLSKMGVTTTNIQYANYNVQNQLSENGAGGLEKIDDDTVRISFSPKSSGDHRLGYNNSTVDGHASGGNVMIDFEIMFQNGNSTEQETPLGTLNMAFRQDYKYQSSGFPLSSDGGFPSEYQSMSLFTGGKFCGKQAYLTNVWYKCRIFFDMATKKNDGTLKGGISLYIAEKENGEYGEFVLGKAYTNFTLNSLMHFRFEPRSAGGASSITFKNVKIIREEPKPVWYLNSADCTNEKISLEFSEDFDTLTAENIKLFNTINKDENGAVVPEEVKITSVTKLESGKFEIVPAKKLLYGKDYEIRLKNGLKSTENSVGFTEPDTDENGDGFWTLATVTAPKYTLNIKSIYESATAANITFNNPDTTTGKSAAVIWKNSSGAMVDLAIDEVTVGDNEQQTFSRSNSETAQKDKVMIFEFNTDATSENFGAIKIYEIN